jgi:type IV secretion system protein VirB4
MFKVKDYRDKKKSYGDLLGWFGLVDDGVMETTTGLFLASWYFRGEDLASSTPEELENLSAQINSILAQLDGRWSLHVDSSRLFTKGYAQQGAFPDTTTLTIDEERRALYEAEGTHLETAHALTVAWEVPTLTAAKVEAWVYGDETPSTSKAEHKQHMLEKFKRLIESFEVSLSSILQLRRMHAYEVGKDEFGRPNVYDSMLEYFEFCATGRQRAVRLPTIPAYIDRAIGSIGLSVESLIANVGFGTGNIVRIGTDTYVRTVTITGYPSSSHPSILSRLDHLGIEYRWNTRFLCMDPYQAQNKIKSKQRVWDQKKKSLVAQVRNDPRAKEDSDAVEMVSETQAALAEVNSGLVRYGHYTSTVVLMDTAIERLTEKVGEVKKLLSNLGFECIEEDINNADAFIGTMPGNRLANVRGGLHHTLHLGDLLPLTSLWAGYEQHPSPLYPPGSPPLLYARTTGTTPFHLCLHVDDVGHALMLGPTGSGKTTALNLLIASHFRYPDARVFGFDRKNGSQALCLAAGGDYYDIGAAGAELQFCPLGDIDSPTNQAWAVEYVEACCTLQGLEMSPSKRELIRDAIKRLASGAEGRSLSDFVGIVQSAEIRQAMDHYTLKGPMGHLLDAQEDNLRDSRFMMFEMEHLGSMGEKNAVPVLLYLFHEMEKRMQAGTPTFVPCDESWLMFKHPIFAPKLEEWLRTWRSKNAHVLLATQEPADVLNSPIRDVVMASTPTKILLPNPNARADQRSLYELLQCNETEIELIASATRKQHYYYKSPVGRRMFSLGLGPVAMAFVGATSRTDLNEIMKLRSELGESWPAEWLVRKGQPEWAAYWRRMH